MAKYKLAAFDLDETLLEKDKSIAKETHAALQELRRAGTAVVLATGRHFLSARRISQELGLDSDVICYNGAMLRSCNKTKPDYVHYVDGDCVREIASFCKHKGFYLQIYNEENQIMVNRITEKTLADPDCQNTTCLEVGDLTTLDSYHTPKMLIFEEPKTIESLYTSLSDCYQGRLYFSQSREHLLEITAKGVNKGDALRRLAERLGASSSETAAFGDNSNDATMIVWAGLGVAVGNAAPSLKECAGYICQKPRGAGVCEAIYKFML